MLLNYIDAIIYEIRNGKYTGVLILNRFLDSLLYLNDHKDAYQAAGEVKGCVGWIKMSEDDLLCP